MTTVSGSLASSWERRVAGIIGYAAIYVVILPVLLAVWMRRLDDVLGLPPWGSPRWGVALVVAGLLLIAAGAFALWRFGGGLPMSPYPPARLVTRGVYRFVSHPIYTGAVLVCAGGALAWRSAAGLMIVSPVLALAALAFVLGYERDATRRRVGQPLRARAPAPAGWLARLALAAWGALCRTTEIVANSWREWRLGRVRFMSHGVFAAVGATLGAGVAIWLAGGDYTWWIVGMTLAAELGAAAWAQIIEGSPQLLRPYGYFGAVGGASAFAAVAGAMGHDGWRLLAAMAAGACFTQAFGRLRCLVQGCCHGRPVEADWGIRYRHPRSRVVWFSHMQDQPLHPTPLYSILWTLVTAIALLLLWRLPVPLPFIPGSYLILIGLGRFVEEHFRGEPQTVCLGGLRLYQWLAIGFVVSGAVLTAIVGPPAVPAAEPPGLAIVPILAGVMVVTYLAFGVDFPGSNRRFSRLV